MAWLRPPGMRKSTSCGLRHGGTRTRVIEQPEGLGQRGDRLAALLDVLLGDRAEPARGPRQVFDFDGSIFISRAHVASTAGRLVPITRTPACSASP